MRNFIWLVLVPAMFVSSCCWYSTTSGNVKFADCNIKTAPSVTDSEGEEYDITFDSCRLVFEDDSGGCMPNGGASRQRFLVQVTTDGNDQDSWRTPTARSLTFLGDYDTYGSYDASMARLSSFERPYDYKAMVEKLNDKERSGMMILSLPGDEEALDYRASGESVLKDLILMIIAI